MYIEPWTTKPLSETVSRPSKLRTIISFLGLSKEEELSSSWSEVLNNIIWSAFAWWHFSVSLQQPSVEKARLAKHHILLLSQQKLGKYEFSYQFHHHWDIETDLGTHLISIYRSQCRVIRITVDAVSSWSIICLTFWVHFFNFILKSIDNMIVYIHVYQK